MSGIGASAVAPVAIRYFLGKCMPSVKRSTARIRITQLELDKNLLMYFPTYKFVFADDPSQQCKTGDTVLIQTLPQRKSKLVAHQVIKVVYPLGDITDPITGKKAVVSRFREDIKAVNELYGESPEAFDYDKLPPRGSMEGKRDFSHKIGFVKYHDDPNDPMPHAL